MDSSKLSIPFISPIDYLPDAPKPLGIHPKLGKNHFSLPSPYPQKTPDRAFALGSSTPPGISHSSGIGCRMLQ